MQELEGFTAVLLAGGFGTRLRAALPDCPKVLAPVHGRPFLTYVLDYILEAGISRVVLCTGYMGEQVRRVMGEQYGNIQLIYSQESSPLGTAGGLRFAFPLLKSDPVLVMNGDSFCEAELKAMWSIHSERDAVATLLLTKVQDTKRYTRVYINEDGLVLSFDENEGGPGWINAGVYFLSHRLLIGIPTGSPVSLENQVFPSWISREIYGWRGGSHFIDIGTPQAYGLASEFFGLQKIWRFERGLSPKTK